VILGDAWIILLQQSTIDLSYLAMFMKGMSFEIACANPCEETSSCELIYSKNVLLVHWPAHCISSAIFLFRYSTIPLPDLSKCKPIFDNLNPALPVRHNTLTASFTTLMIWERQICCQGNATDSQNEQISMSSMAYLCTRLTALATTALTGQHDVSPF